MTKEQMIPAFNEWMRRYIEEPHRYEAEFQTVNKFLAEDDGDREPSYGESCTAYLQSIVAEMAA